MDVVFLIGRILFVLIFLLSGLFGQLRRDTIEYARSYNAPAPGVTVPVTGILIAAGALMVGFGVIADLGALILAAFALLVAPIMHAFWKEQDEQMAQVQMAMFMRNVSMAGGAIIIFWVYNQFQDLPLSLTDPLFSAW